MDTIDTSRLEVAIAERIQRAANAAVHAGFLANATYPTGEYVAEIALKNEFGDVRQPPRPFFRRAIAKDKARWVSLAKRLLQTHGIDTHRALSLLGISIEDDIRQSIIDLVSPPLSPVTIARKGFDKPLIDTSHMLNSVSSEVVE